MNPVIAAHWIAQNVGREALFTLSTRDMNRMAIQGLLLGAEVLGLENVVVVQGDPFRGKDLDWTVAVDDYKPTELIESIGGLNRGVDFKGLKLRTSSDFCVGAIIDLGKPLREQVRLTRRKVEAGTRFFLLQALFEPGRLTAFLDAYAQGYGEPLERPIFCGVQVMVPDGITFGEVPDWVSEGLDKGRDGVDIAVELIGRYRDAGFTNVYLVPPIFKGGRRDYESAARVLEAFGR